MADLVKLENLCGIARKLEDAGELTPGKFDELFQSARKAVGTETHLLEGLLTYHPAPPVPQPPATL